MKPDQILGAVTTLRVTDPDGCDRAALSDLAGLVRQVRGWLDAVEATIATCADAVVGAGGADTGSGVTRRARRRGPRRAV